MRAFLYYFFSLVSVSSAVLYSNAASRVYGKPSFTATSWSPPLDANKLFFPSDVYTDSKWGVYIVDSTFGNRVLRYPFDGGSTTATAVYGQNGSYATSAAGTTASTLRNPSHVAVHPATGDVYISDTDNHRIVVYSPNNNTVSATLVYGQVNFVTGLVNRGMPVPDAASFNTPMGIAFDQVTHGLYVTDNNNNRVLYFPNGSTTATRVYGQMNNFNTRASNNGGLSPSSLWSPRDVATFVGGGLIAIADTANNRVTIYQGTSTIAVRVLNGPGMYFPQGLCFDDTADGLFVCDTSNNRLLYFSISIDTATIVFGQRGSFETTTQNTGGKSAQTLAGPRGMIATSSGLFIADSGNGRALMYPVIGNRGIAPDTGITYYDGAGVAFNSSLILNKNSSFTLGTGNLTVEGDVISLDGGNSTLIQVVTDSLIIEENATLSVTLDGTNVSYVPNQVVSVVVATYANGAVSGSFKSTSMVLVSPCQTLTNVAPVYGLGTLLMVGTVEDSCSYPTTGGGGTGNTGAGGGPPTNTSSNPSGGGGGGESPPNKTGMIVGISIGCVVVAAVSMTLLVKYMRNLRLRKDALANASLKKVELDNLRRTVVAQYN